ncbi:MAG: hypothetical protein Q8941_12480, partial [Bacteroidota bacterium]|nr:hypothetical protein [Bacteroidota bacterium]
PSNAGEQILIIPAREDLKTAKGIDQKSAVYLVLILNSQKNISKGNVVIYKPAGGSSSDIPANTFHNIINGLSPGCSGLFKFLSVTGRSIYQLEYSNKKLSSIGIVKHKPKSGATVNGTSVVNSIQCYDYYLTLTFWLDDVPVDQVTTYLGTSCEGTGGCDESIYESFCPDSGGGGGEPGVDCEIPDMVSGVESVSETVNTHVSDINGVTRHKDPEWKILKGLTWALYSHETGTIQHVTSPVDRWEWRTLTHGSITFNGQTIGGDITYTQGAGTPSFTPGASNILYAGMSLSFAVTYHPVCNCPIINYIFPATTISYTAYAIWDANPV